MAHEPRWTPLAVFTRETFRARRVADAELRALAEGVDAQFAFRCEGEEVQFAFVEGDESSSGGDSKPEFAVILHEGAWRALLRSDPGPRTQAVLAHLQPLGDGRVEGDPLRFAQHLPLVRRLIELGREGDARVVQAAAPPSYDLVSVEGRYVSVELPCGRVNLYTESVGNGQPVLMLATAGSDSRQYHGLMAEPSLTSQYRLVTVDLPWHGRSSPPLGAVGAAYRLDAASYVATVTETIRALALDRPVVLGSSMAGAVVIEVLAATPELVRGAVGAQVGPRVRRRRTSWLRSPEVNQTLHVPEWVFGLMSPRSPKAYRDQVWWGYSQGGFGAYDADLAYYTAEWDVERVADALDLERTPLVLLSGSYDYSVPPTATRELHERLPGSVFREMPELGHFPHAENPPVFAGHLRWALDTIEERAGR